MRFPKATALGRSRCSQNPGNALDQDKWLCPLQVEVRVMFSAFLEADRHVQLPLPELSAHRDTGFPLTVPGPVVAELQDFAGHDRILGGVGAGCISKN